MGASEPRHEPWQQGSSPIAWPVRYSTAALAFVTTVLPAAGLVVVAIFLNAYGCDESCGGSGWTQARFSWVWHAQLWLLALPALIAALAVVTFLAMAALGPRCQRSALSCLVWWPRCSSLSQAVARCSSEATRIIQALGLAMLASSPSSSAGRSQSPSSAPSRSSRSRLRTSGQLRLPGRSMRPLILGL